MSKKTHRSFKSTLLVGWIIFSVVIILILAFISYHYYLREKGAAIHDATLQGELIGMRIAQHIHDIEEQLTPVFGLPQAHKAETAQFSQHSYTLQQVLQHQSLVKGVILTSAGGDFLDGWHKSDGLMVRLMSSDDVVKSISLQDSRVESISRGDQLTTQLLIRPSQMHRHYWFMLMPIKLSNEKSIWVWVQLDSAPFIQRLFNPPLEASSRFNRWLVLGEERMPLMLQQTTEIHPGLPEKVFWNPQQSVIMLKHALPDVKGQIITKISLASVYTRTGQMLRWPVLIGMVMLLAGFWMLRRFAWALTNSVDLLAKGLNNAAQGVVNPLRYHHTYKELTQPLLNFNKMVEQRRVVQNAITSIVSSTDTDVELLKSMLDQMALLVNADYAFVGLVDPLERTRMNTITLVHQGCLLDNVSYQMPGTPCADVQDGGICIYPRKIQSLFPEDTLLQDMRIQGYIGVPIYNDENSFIGVLALLTCKSFADIPKINDLLMLYSVRISVELKNMDIRQSLDDAQQRLVLYRERSQLPIIEFSPNRHILDWNPAAEKLFGHTKAEVLGKDAVDLLVATADRPIVERMFVQLRNKTGGEFSINRNLTHEQQVIHCQWHNTALTKNNNEVIAIISVVENVTSRLASEKARKVLREQLESEVAIRTRALKQEIDQNKKLILAIEQSNSSVCITDINKEIEYVNPVFTRLTGFSLVDVLGKTPEVLIAEQQSKEIYEQVWESVEKNGFWQGELINQSKTGKAYWVHSSITALFSKPGVVSNYVIVEENITEHKRLTQELRAKIEEQTKARLAMIDIMRDLDEAKSIAESATEAKSRFLANMSHEIRTPMNAIIGINHLLQQTQLSQHQKIYAEKIDLAAKTLLAVINDILDFSKIEAGKIEVEITQFNLDMLFASVAEMSALPAQNKGIEFIINIAPNIPQTLKGDMHRLQQVLLNFCSNAAKFTEQGEIILKAALVNQTRDEVLLKFSVSDTGIGINKNVLQSLGRPFTQADPSTTRQFGGTGLGLVICKRLIELMGGEFFVRSQLGKGSEFGFTLRLNYEPHTAEAEMSDEGVRLLLIDDNARFLKLTSSILQAYGYQVETALDCEQALSKINQAEEPFQLVLMDWDNQAERRLCKIIAETRIQPDNVIAILNSYRQDQLIDQVDHIGLEGVLVKPLTPTDLLNGVANKLSSYPLRKQEIAQQSNTQQGLSQKSILLVEDNKINQLVAVDLLEQVGANVTVAENGVQALDKLADAEFDLVIMDIQMPEMDGYEATSEIRKNPTLTDLPVIAMSANVLQEDVNRCKEVGMNDYISKPVMPEKLYELLNKWL